MSPNKSSGKKSGRGLRIPRQGAGTAILLGGPNAGKSQLICSLTHATPEVAPYPFTTRTPAPAMMPFEDVTVQLIDTPPITKDYMDPHLFGLVRSADLALLMVDLAATTAWSSARKCSIGSSGTKTRLAATSYLDENDVGLSYTRTFVVPNKIDLPEAAGRLELFHELCPLDFAEYPISATAGTGLEALREAIYRSLDMIRVYSKLPTAKEPDRERPFTVPPRQPTDRHGRAGPQGLHQGPEVRPRLGRGGPRRHRGQKRLRVARQGRGRIAHLSIEKLVLWALWEVCY